MGKKRILIASVLKPITDTRMFEKTGLSLAKLLNTEIHIFGVGKNSTETPENIIIHPMLPFYRLGISRITAHYKYFKTLIKVKPEVVIPNTFELLPVTLLYKILFNVKIIYDIRENYAFNILHQPTYPGIFRNILAGFVNLIQNASAPFISHFWLAEKSYSSELKFLKNNFTILENKFQTPANYIKPETPKQINENNLNLLYSGTIAEVYGIFEAVKLTDALYKLNNNVRLTVIGFCPLKETLIRLKEMIYGKPYISLIGGEILVPHSEIIEAIRHSDVGLLPYHPNPSIFNCYPTKVFEYMAYALPMLVQNNPLWSDSLDKAAAGFSIDFSDFEPARILNLVSSKQFYAKGIPNDIFWSSEEIKLYKSLETLT